MVCGAVVRRQGPVVSTITIYSFFPAFFMFVFGTTASIVYTAADRSACGAPLIAFFIGCIALVRALALRRAPSARRLIHVLWCVA